jgi:hypothetical protein
MRASAQLLGDPIAQLSLDQGLQFGAGLGVVAQQDRGLVFVLHHCIRVPIVGNRALMGRLFNRFLQTQSRPHFYQLTLKLAPDQSTRKGDSSITG